MPENKWALLAMALLLLGCLATAAIAAEQPYYKGKTIRFIVGFSPGGGHDTYTRLMAKYMSKHIPGNPTIIVQNMLGGGSLIAANYLYQRAEPDGLTIGKFASGLIRQQVLGRPEVKFDAREFGWLGAPTQDHLVCAISTKSGFENWKDVMATTPDKPLVIGGIAPGASLSDDPRLIQAALQFPMNLVEGYQGSADVRRATESGEVHGGCWGWASVSTTWRDGLQSGNVEVMLQVMPEKHADLQDVPTALEFAESDEAKRLLTIASNGGRLLRNYAIPPGTPQELQEILQKAFMDTMQDPEFVAAANKARLDLNPLTGPQVAELVEQLFDTPPETREKLKPLLLPKG